MTGGNGSAEPDNVIGQGEPQPTIQIDLLQAIALHGHYSRLKAELASYAKGAPRTELIRATRQLGAMIQRLQSDPEVIALNIHQPVLKLYGALVDLCAGGKPSLLCEPPRPDDVRTKQKVAFVHFPQGVLAIGYAALVERGRYKPARGMQWFDKELRHRNMAVRGADVRGWYHQAKAPRGKPAAHLMEAFRRYQPQLVNLRNAAEAESFATKCVAAVHGMGLERLKLRKPKPKGS